MIDGIIYMGFEPVYDDKSRILILGSFPSVMSRDIGFFYGNRHNRFWRVLSLLFEEKIGNLKEEKIDFLIRHRVALWDIVSACEIKGSLDSDIRNVKVADINKIIKNSNIEKIFCNGKKSYELTLRYYGNIGIPIIYLPSTSPANTKFSVDDWREKLYGYLK